ncbi:hypothetical protein BKA56DRAFT_500868, partial [Ilyonectria sp. MPI-CAGE-AT-0026]
MYCSILFYCHIISNTGLIPPSQPQPPQQNASPPCVVDSTDSDAHPSSSKPQGSDSSSHSASGNSLWQQAYDKLSREDFSGKLKEYEKYVLEQTNDSESGTTQQSRIQEWAREALNNLSGNRLVIPAGNKKFVVRDKIHQFIKSIAKYKNIIAAGVAADPTAALAWGGAMAIIPFLENAFQQDEDAATGFEQICFLVALSNVVEDRLNARRQSDQQSKPDTTISLPIETEQEIVKLYTIALRYQIRLLVHYSRSSFSRGVRDAVRVDVWANMLKDANDVSVNIKSGFDTLASDIILSTLPDVYEDFKALLERETLTWVGSALFDSRGVEEHGGCLEGT